MSDPESQLVHELRGLAGGPSGDTFSIGPRGHAAARVSVRHAPGSSSSVELAIDYDALAVPHASYRGEPLAAIRPLAIHLRAEEESDRTAKRGGMDVEFQTGDRAFDDRVYVDTQTPHAVLVTILGPDVRAGVLELFDLGFQNVHLDDGKGRVTAQITAFATLNGQERPGERALAAFLRIAGALPRVTRIAGSHARHPLARPAIAILVPAIAIFFVATPIYFVGIRKDVCDVGGLACLGPAVIGVVAGLLLAAPIALLAAGFTRRFAGRSDSSRHGATFTGAVALLAFDVLSLAIAAIVAHAW